MGLQRKGIAGILLCLLLAGSLLLPACGAQQRPSLQAVAVAPSPLPAPAGLRIAAASDLHLNPTLRPDPKNPYQIAYSMELTDALLRDARVQGAKMLLLTGDLCNSGRIPYHEALTEKLRHAEEEGLEVFVLPGNHDLAPLSQQAFAELYGEFGYEEASSRDAASLSYSVERDGLMLLMMDTGGYSRSAADLPGAPERENDGAFLSEETLRWAAVRLREAKEKGLAVLCAGHYNLLPELSRGSENNGYYLENGDAFARLLRADGVPLYLSGHLHQRALYRENGLNELVTEFLLAYPTGYSMLDIDGNEIRVFSRRIDVDGWAAAEGLTDPVLRHYAQWQQEELLRSCTDALSHMAENRGVSGKELLDAETFFYDTLNAYWEGSLAAQRTRLLSLPGSGTFFRCAEGYAYGWWLQDLLDHADRYPAEFSLSW